jgi:hypothetical protein
MRNDAPTLRHICDGLFTDVDTGQQVITRMEIHHDGTESWTMLVIGDGPPHRAHLLPEQFAWWRDTLFPPPPGSPASVPAPVVNLDRTPRNQLRDRLRQRRARQIESSAAD